MFLLPLDTCNASLLNKNIHFDDSKLLNSSEYHVLIFSESIVAVYKCVCYFFKFTNNFFTLSLLYKAFRHTVIFQYSV